MTVMDILEHIKQLTPDEQDELIQHILDLRVHIRKAKTGAELVAMLKQMDPIEFVDPHIQDPVEWVKAQRQKEADRLKPYWDGEK